MTDPFSHFVELVHLNFKHLATRSLLFSTTASGDALYASYLAAFPDDTNPVFRESTEHDCSTCKHFIRRVANVVAVVDGAKHTVWDAAAKDAEEPYRTVAIALRNAVLNCAINNLFAVGANELTFGAKTTRSQTPDGQVETWHHFHTGKIPSDYRHAMPDTVRGDFRSAVQVFERGLTELTPDAVESVLAMIDANSLYRGAEHRPAVVAFQQAQQKYEQTDTAERNAFMWSNVKGNRGARFRNTVVGTLVTEISSGVPIEQAVGAFEAKVAPHNYKRTSAIITPIMVNKAMETVAELGLESALERRFARIDDISVNDVLWVDGSIKPQMKGGIGDVLMKAAVSSQKVDPKRAQDIAIDDFVANIIPSATAIELFFQGQHKGNLMSLTAPVNPEPAQLFRWTNDFAWSYAGNIADSIKERVKRAGGNVENAVLRASLSWTNHDDLDIHVHEPGGSHIHYGSKNGRQGGQLDVDMNVHPESRSAVENVSWSKRPPDGVYQIKVNNYTHRESVDVGFTIEIDCRGQVQHFSYPKEVRHKETIDVVDLTVAGGEIVATKIGNASVSAATLSQEVWGIKTEEFANVEAVTLSPNYWGDNAVGNKHTFFVLENAKNEEAARGIYNEFLHPRLEAHRKVFEVIGDKTKCQPTDGQLSGVGFSSTKKESVIVRVTQGNAQRLFNIKVGELDVPTTSS